MNPDTSLWSEVGQGIDYYFMYGPALDKVISSYRQITGPAPMMPEWTFGFWQSRQRYKTQQESLDVLAGYRARDIPIDNIVQDWFYWREDQWGSHEFDPARFPDPDGWIREIHDKYHAHLTISVWPKFYAGTTNFEIMRAHHFLYEENLADEIQIGLAIPTRSMTRSIRMRGNCFGRKSIPPCSAKAWMAGGWTPANRICSRRPRSTASGPFASHYLGTGAAMMNAYPLENSEGIYEGQRS